MKLSNYKKKFQEGKAVVKHRSVTKLQLRTHQKQVLNKEKQGDQQDIREDQKSEDTKQNYTYYCEEPDV